MSSYPWLSDIYRQLVAWHQHNRAHHALLIHAVAGLGDDRLVRALGRWLMCQKRNGIKSCGQCHGCQLMKAGNHPDCYLLQAEKGKHSLGVDAVRNVTEKLWHRAQQNGAKIVLIPAANQLTEAAANALLKSLEEPPSDSWFFLSSDEPQRLLATIRSRCMLWHLSPPDETQSLRWIQAQQPLSKESCIAALRLSSGAPLAALTLLDEKQWQARQLLCRAFNDALQQDLLSLMPVLNVEAVAERIHWLCSLLTDGMKWQVGAAQCIINVDQQALIKKIALRFPLAELNQSLYNWILCRDKIRHVVSVNRELLLTNQLLNWEQHIESKAVFPSL